QREDPQRVRGPPVVLVAVNDHRVVARDPLTAEQFGKALAVDVVAHDRVVEFGVPVDLHRTRNMAGLVEEYVFIGLDDDESGFAETSGEPLRADQASGFG